MSGVGWLGQRIDMGSSQNVAHGFECIFAIAISQDSKPDNAELRYMHGHIYNIRQYIS